MVEDHETIGPQIVEAANSFFDAKDSVEAVLLPAFETAAARLESERFDLVVLDLRDDGADPKGEMATPAGLDLFEQIKRLRFLPVIFYTAHPNYVGDVESPFVRVVEKTRGIEALQGAVQEVMATQLPELVRWMERIQREYLWDMIANHWPSHSRDFDGVSVAHLMTRRLAAVLAAELRGKETKEATSHPLEKYVFPPVPSSQRLSGDILRGKVDGRDSYWLVMSPSCDLIRAGRVEFALIAECVPLTESAEFRSWKESKKEEKLNNLIQDRRQGQPERYKFLPGTHFIDDRIVDFQRLVALKFEELTSLKHVCSLDSPFAEAFQAGLARNLGRIGTPDIDLETVKARLAST